MNSNDSFEQNLHELPQTPWTTTTNTPLPRHFNRHSYHHLGSSPMKTHISLNLRNFICGKPLVSPSQLLYQQEKILEKLNNSSVSYSKLLLNFLLANSCATSKNIYLKATKVKLVSIDFMLALNMNTNTASVGYILKHGRTRNELKPIETTHYF